MHKILLASLILFSTTLGVTAQNDSIIVDTVVRKYLLHLPTQYDASNTYPLVFNLHGFGSNGAQQELYSQMSSTANLNDFIIVYPEGIYNIWNTGFSLASDSLFDDVAFISQLIDSLAAEYPINLDQVYSCGMSMGGFMSYRLACELDDKIAAIASVTGSMTELLFNSCNPSRNVPILEMHGTLDSTVLYDGNDSLGIKSIPSVIDFWTQQHNCPVAPVVENLADNVNEGSTITRHTYAPCDLSSEVILYEVVNGGHTWPGAFFNIVSAGITNRDIKAQQVIWDFFKQHTLSNPPTNIAVPEAESLDIYPNPTVNSITVESGNTARMFVQIRDLLGNLSFEQQYSNHSGTVIIPLEFLESGTYTVFVRSDAKSYSKKLVVVK